MVCERRVYPFPNQLLYVNMLKLAKGAIALGAHIVIAFINACLGNLKSFER
jgi:hypothetical protein